VRKKQVQRHAVAILKQAVFSRFSRSAIALKQKFGLAFFLMYKRSIFAAVFEKNSTKMKKEIHPSNYRLVVFKDMSNEYSFLTKSCIDSKETVQWEDGQEYPLIKLEISHTSHPFYTGKMKLVDTAGRIDKFRTRYNKK
jgi:large subunit ribosomal protein L31